jgi:hypothetical protein
MKQGRASRDVRESTKVEPKAMAINPKWTSQIGSAMGNHSTDRSALLPKDKVIEKMHQGRGYQSPRDYKVEIFNRGSQKRS